MLVPDILTRVKETDRVATVRIDSFARHPFVGVAVRACQSEIVQLGGAAGRTRDDVVDRKGSHLPARRQMTILTAVSGPGRHFGPPCRREGAHGRSAKSGNAVVSRRRA